jgi:hypothetical protein
MSNAGLDTRMQPVERRSSAPKPSASTIRHVGAVAKLLLLGSPLASNHYAGRYCHAHMLPGADLSTVWMGSGPIDRELWESFAPRVPVLETGREPTPLWDSLSQLGVEKTVLTTLVTPLAVALSPAPHVVAPSSRLRRAAWAAHALRHAGLIDASCESQQ